MKHPHFNSFTTLKKRDQSPRFFLCFSKLKFTKLILVLALPFLLVSCQENEPIANESNYFSTKHFFESEFNRLNSRSTLVKKITLLNGKIDSTGFKTVDWKKELELFENSDINKPAWKSSFKVDSIRIDSSLLIRYTAMDSAISVQLLEIKILENQVKSIHVRKASSNFIYKTAQQLSYYVDSSYTIQGSQNVLWFYHSNYKVSGYLEKKK